MGGGQGGPALTVYFKVTSPTINSRRRGPAPPSRACALCVLQSAAAAARGGSGDAGRTAGGGGGAGVAPAPAARGRTPPRTAPPKPGERSGRRRTRNANKPGAWRIREAECPEGRVEPAQPSRPPRAPAAPGPHPAPARARSRRAFGDSAPPPTPTHTQINARPAPPRSMALGILYLPREEGHTY